MATPLADLFLAALVPRLPDPPPLARVEALLDAAFVAARAAAPDVALAAEVFLPYLAERVPADVELEAGLGALRVSDLYLACACAGGDPAALRAFEGRCLGVVDLALGRMDLSAEMVDEVKQIVRRRLLVADGQAPRITEYAGRGDLRSWIRVVAVRAAVTIIRRRSKEIPTEDDLLEKSVPAGADPELSYLKEMYRAEFKQAFREAMDSLTDRECNLLRHQFIDGLTLDDMAALYRVHRATIARWLVRARAQLLKLTQRSLGQRLRVAPSEMDSVMRLIQSKLDVSLPALLRVPGGPTTPPGDD